jgi:hypothetical protein
MTALQHVYVTAHGSFVTGSWVGEAAQFGLRLATVGTPDPPEKGTIFTLPLHGDVEIDQGQESGTNGLLTKTWTARRGGPGSLENFDAGWQIDVAEDVRKFLDAIKAYTSSAFKWSHVKMAAVSAAGDTLQSSSVYQFTTPLGGTATSMLPPQIAMALSLRANIIGRRGRGRIYLPAVGANTIDSAGTINGSVTNAIRPAFVTLVNDLQNLPGTPEQVPIVTIMSPGSATGVRPSQVRTGQRLDTIRSRREQVPEIYTPTDL